jgi:hypothetical protein
VVVSVSLQIVNPKGQRLFLASPVLLACLGILKTHWLTWIERSRTTLKMVALKGQNWPKGPSMGECMIK